jgi:hypothetical protein
MMEENLATQNSEKNLEAPPLLQTADRPQPEGPKPDAQSEENTGQALLPEKGHKAKCIHPGDLDDVIVCKKLDLNSKFAETYDSEYSRTPIDGFGLQLLNVMGFAERGGVGRSLKNQMEKPIQYLPRQSGVGLGAIPKSILEAKIREGKTGGNINYDMRTYCSLDETKLENPDLLNEGQLIIIKDGKHSGMEGLVLQYNEENEEVSLKLIANNRNVRVLRRMVVKKEEAQTLKDAAHTKKDRKDKNKKDKKKTTNGGKDLKWVEPGIVLKIVNKKYRSGKFYLSAGV